VYYAPAPVVYGPPTTVVYQSAPPPTTVVYSNGYPTQYVGSAPYYGN
jgi:hypothetical protein